MTQKMKEHLKILLLIVLLVVVGIFTYLAFFQGSDEMQAIMMSHFKAVVGLPAAFISSLILILLLKQTAGPIEFKGFSLEFKGTSGEIIMWILCFLSIVYAIDKLW